MSVVYSPQLLPICLPLQSACYWATGGFLSLVRYTGVGALATLSHYMLTIFLVEVTPTPASWASWWGAWLGAAVALMLNRRLTFKPSSRSNWGLAWRFGAVALLGAMAHGIMVSIGTGWDWHYLLAQALATSLILPMTYLLNKHWTFR